MRVFSNGEQRMRRFEHAIIIGASSGIGLALAQALARAGTRVALVARRGDELAAICGKINETAGATVALSFPHDVHDTAGVPDLFQRIARDLGGVDLVVYSAGILPPIGPETYDTPIDSETIAVNFVGAVAWLNAAAERFAHVGGGVIAGISSVAGDRGRRAHPSYAASKAALSAYLEGLRNRLGRHGTRVVTIKPGYVATPMIAGASLPRFLPVVTADQAAARIIRAAGRNRGEVYVPGIWRPIMWIVKAVPSPVFQRINL